MKLLISAATLLILFNPTAIAASLSIPMAFEYIALDGKQVETNSFTHKADLPLTDGTHKIAIRYHDMVQDDHGDGEHFVKSSPFIVTLDVESGQQYLLTPKQGVVKDPKTFATSPEIIISREDGNRVNYQIEQTQYKESSFISGLFGDSGDNIEILTNDATRLDKSAVTTPEQPQTATVTTATAVSNHKSQQPKASETAHAQQMLQYWWLHADEETRKEFMSWAIKQL